MELPLPFPHLLLLPLPVAGPGAADAFHAAYLAFCFLPLFPCFVSPTDHNKQPQSRAEAETETQTAQIICARIKKEDEPVWAAPPPRSPPTTYFLCPLKAAFDSEQTREEVEAGGSLPGDTNND